MNITGARFRKIEPFLPGTTQFIRLSVERGARADDELHIQIPAEANGFSPARFCRMLRDMATFIEETEAKAGDHQTRGKA
jgi:hypothetical protein